MSSKNNNKPNVLMIISDDQGYWALGCAGNSEIMTPNIDNLSRKGMMFENFFCASPVCSPARASIFTGKIPSQHGILDWIAKGHVDDSVLSDDLKSNFKIGDCSWEYQWPKSQLKGEKAIRYLDGHTTFTELLSKHGYFCGLSGKWHMGDSFNPQAGFTYWKTTAMGGDNYMYPVVLKNNEMVLEKGKYITNYITENAIDFLKITKEDDSPFFLSVNYTAPHSPWQKEHHPPEFYELYNDCKFLSTPNADPHRWVGDPNSNSLKSKEEQNANREMCLHGYFAAVSAMDNGIGKIIDELEMNGMLESTVILFTSDNGMSMGHHGIFGKGNGTFPLNMYDTAVKVPMIISYPKRIECNVKKTQMLSHYDLFQTILDFTNTPYDKDEDLPGCSFLQILTGEKEEVRDEVVVFDEYGPTRMIRTKEYKYIHRYPYGEHELYDMINDPEEENNIIDNPAFKNIREQLLSKLTKWYVKYADPAYDGKCEPVTGKGQLYHVGVASDGKRSFD